MWSTIFTIAHIVMSIVLILIVLLQSGKSFGLSGSIAGGAETFFGKNRGRTIDAMLERLTTVVAILFIVTSIVLAFVK
ncbi:MAG: preprotein translocase subunit SecG [Eubacteriales bacterium]|jgi:preprotein translocase subunit SecG|nr:preprotein translocase subunit SecG [Eubacteriales bacterium]